MPKILATYRQGQVLLDHSVDWPDGTRIEVRPADLETLAQALSDPDRVGLDESLWPTTREGIDLLLAHMDAAEPLDLTLEQQRSIDAALESSKRQQKELVKESWSEMEQLF